MCFHYVYPLDRYMYVYTYTLYLERCSTNELHTSPRLAHLVDICVSVCLPICLYLGTCLSVCLVYPSSICLHISLYIFMCVCMYHLSECVYIIYILLFLLSVCLCLSVCLSLCVCYRSDPRPYTCLSFWI